MNKSNQGPLLNMVQVAAACINHDIRYLCSVDKRWLFYFGEATAFPNHICILSSSIEIYLCSFYNFIDSIRVNIKAVKFQNMISGEY